MARDSILRGASVILAIYAGCGSSLANDAPEYLRVRAPIADTLENVPSTTGAIGVTPESWTASREAFALSPAVYLPMLREKYVPKTGVSFVDDAIFTVRPRFYHRYRDAGDDLISEATTGGGAMGYESGWWEDTVRINLAGFTSQKFYGPEDRDGTGLLRENQQSYTVLGEAFGEFKVGDDTSIFAGRTPVDMPYINANDSRMTPNTFRAVGVRSLAIPNLQVAAGHADRVKFRNSSNFVPMSVLAGAPGTDEGVSVIGARYNFGEDIYLGLIDQYGWDMYNTVYLESDYRFELTDDLDLRVGAQFTDQRSTGAELLGGFSTRSGGVKAALGYHGFILSSSFTATANDSGIRNPWGGNPSFNSSMISDFDRAGEKATRLGISYDLTRLGLTGLAASGAWMVGNTPETGDAASPDQREFNVTVDIRPDIEFLDNIWFRVRYAVNDRDAGGIDSSDFRVILNYSYSF